jgi:hypothetical protein
MGFSPQDPAIRAAVERGLIPADAVTGATKPKRKPRLVALDRSAGWSLTLTPACRVVTEANTHEHWRPRKLRFDVQRAAVIEAWALSPAARGQLERFLPLVVTLTHVGPRMDDDNLSGAFKAIRDELANRIGIDDGDARVKWCYEQRAGKPGVEIRLEPRPVA